MTFGATVYFYSGGDLVLSPRQLNYSGAAFRVTPCLMFNDLSWVDWQRSTLPIPRNRMNTLRSLALSDYAIYCAQTGNKYGSHSAVHYNYDSPIHASASTAFSMGCNRWSADTTICTVSAPFRHFGEPPADRRKKVHEKTSDPAMRTTGQKICYPPSSSILHRQSSDAGK